MPGPVDPPGDHRLHQTEALECFLLSRQIIPALCKV
jgi:hypothetical protein